MPAAAQRQASRWLAAMLAVALVWLQGIPPTFAGEFRVFEETYVRGTGEPVTETDTFRVLNPATTWLLRAINGSLTDSSIEPVSSSTLALNGVEILRPNQFNQNVRLIEEPVSIRASNNTLATQLRSKPGGRLAVSILGRDDQVPALSWQSPTEGQFLNTLPFTGRIQLADDIAGLDPSSLDITLNDASVTDQFPPLDGPTLQADLSAQLTRGDGAYLLHATVRDLASNQAGAAVRFTVDTTPPTLQFVTPTDGAVLDTTTPTIQVSFSDTTSGVNFSSYQTFLDEVDITNLARITETGATYTVASPLADGQHTATATIADRAGNISTATIRFTVSTFRAIADCAPTEGQAPLRVRLRTRGEFPGGSIVRFRWDFQGDGIFDTSDAVARDYDFTFSQRGTFHPVLEALNNLGQTTTDTCTITVSGAPPIASADADPSNGPVPLTVTFTGTGRKPGGSIVLAEWDVDGDGHFDFQERGRTFPAPETITFFINHATCGGNRTFNFFLNGGLIGTATGTTSCVCNSSEPAFSVTDPAAIAANWDEGGHNTLRADFGSNLAVGYIRAQGSIAGNPLFNICLFDQTGGHCVNRDLCAGFRSGGSVSATIEHEETFTSVVEHTYTGEGTFPALFRVTDDEGNTATASATTTAVRVGPPGSPTVEATASPTTGTAPLAVSFSGSATDDGTIVLWEWDFEGDGTTDYASSTSPQTSFTYTHGGIVAAALRATDDAGLSSIDLVEISVDIAVSLSIPDDTIDPTAGESATIRTTLSGGAPVRLIVKNQAGAVVRTLVDGRRSAGSYADAWDGRDDANHLLIQAPYFAILEYTVGTQVRRLDLTNSTGGTRYNPVRNALPSTFKPFNDTLLTINFTIPSSQGASEILAFIGLFNTDTRFLTLLERVPLGVGTHTIHWDGLDANGNIAVPPPGDSFLFGIFGFTLPDNAIFIQSAPVLSNVSVDPNFFDPSTPNFLSPEHPTAIASYDLSKLADVELTVTSLSTGRVVRRIVEVNVPGGAGHTIEWDGRTEEGILVDNGDYRLSLQAIDSTGSRSLLRGVLVRVFY